LKDDKYPKTMYSNTSTVFQKEKKKKAEYSHPIQSFFGQFCDVAKVGIIQGRFSQIWLQDKYESKIFEASFHIFWLPT
jgi:hypothetical protein